MTPSSLYTPTADSEPAVLPGLEKTADEKLLSLRVERKRLREEEAKYEYEAQRSFLLSKAEEASPDDFYNSLFGDRFEEEHGPNWDSDAIPQEERRPNGILTELLPPPFPEDRRVRTRLVFKDLAELAEFAGTERFGFLAPLGYYGQRRRLSNAYSMYALAFDLDGPNMDYLFLYIEGKRIPKPTWIIQSGTGVHLYYQFHAPIPMFPGNAEPLNELKAAMTEAIWNPDTSTIAKVQYQGINQGFRIVGAASKLGLHHPVRAYKIGPKYDRLEQLADGLYNPRLKHLASAAISRVKLEPSGRKWVEPPHESKRQRWHVNRALYDWWKSKVYEAHLGHRYFYLMALAIYARKCDVTLKELKADMEDLRPTLDSVAEAEGRPLETIEDRDITAALRAYQDPYATFPRKSIERLTAIPIPKNKRNYRPQHLHLQIARATRDVLYPDRSWSGNQSKEKVVTAYLEEHPEATPTQIARALNVSRPTVYKYKRLLAGSDST